MELFDKKKIITVFLLVLLWGTVNPVYSETEKVRDIKKVVGSIRYSGPVELYAGISPKQCLNDGDRALPQSP